MFVVFGVIAFVAVSFGAGVVLSEPTKRWIGKQFDKVSK